MENSSDLFDQILTHGPSQGTIFLILTKMKEEGRSKEVLRASLKALNIYPDDIRIRTLLAEAYMQAGFFGLAEAELNKVTLEIENLSSAFKLQADLFAKQDRLEEATESVKRYLAFNPNDQEVIDLLKNIKPVETEEKPEKQKAPTEEKPYLEAVEKKPFSEMLETAEADEATSIEEAEETVADLATPTLAELYYSQGEIQEAVHTYENVLLRNPDDKTSEKRLAELKASIDGNAKPQLSQADVARAKREKTIAILENWLTRIRTLNHG